MFFLKRNKRKHFTDAPQLDEIHVPEESDAISVDHILRETGDAVQVEKLANILGKTIIVTGFRKFESTLKGSRYTWEMFYEYPGKEGTFKTLVGSDGIGEKLDYWREHYSDKALHGMIVQDRNAKTGHIYYHWAAPEQTESQPYYNERE